MQFVAEFWKHLCARLQIQAKLSTAYHPETNGQTERFNAVMEQYLRCYVAYRQDDWSKWLPLVEFTANNHDSSPTSISPFVANYGFNPRFTMAPSVTTDSSTPNSRAQLKVANQFADTMMQISTYLHEEITAAQQYYEEQANTQRALALAYQPGDEVFLLASNINSKQPSKKLDWKKLGHFKIIRAINPYTYLLNLPHTMRISPVVHTSLLRPAADDPVPGQTNLPPPPIIVNEAEEWEVKSIVKSRLNCSKRRFKYLVKWLGYPDATWEPKENIISTAALVNQFYHAYPNKPRPVGWTLHGNLSVGGPPP